MRRPFVWVSFALAVLVLCGIVLQLYFIASFLFGEAGALTAHKRTGDVVHLIEILCFIAGAIGWWGKWRYVWVSFGLAVVGALQAFAAGNLNDPKDGWVHGLHGGLVLFVVAFAAVIARREADALGIRRAMPPAAPAP